MTSTKAAISSRFTGIAGLVSILVGSLAATPRASAQRPEQLDETLPGFKPNAVFDSRGIDNVNLFTGDPGISVPIGPTYQLGRRVRWGLRATYTSKIWVTQGLHDCGDRFTPYPIVSLLGGSPALGAGWSIDLGHVGPGGYHSPDGGLHRFATNVDEICSSASCTSIDGTRMRITSSGGTSPAEWYVDFPDGTKHVFSQKYAWPLNPTNPGAPDFSDQPYHDSSGTRWGLTKIVDAEGLEILSVSYAGPGDWRVASILLNPGAAPSTITFNWDDSPLIAAYPTLDSISLPSASGSPLLVSFDFVSQAPHRPVYSPGRCPLTSSSSNAPFLSSISVDSGGTDPSVYAFTYDFSGPDGNGNYPVSSGVMTSYQLPTGATVSYGYAEVITDTTVGCGDLSATTLKPGDPGLTKVLPEDAVGIGQDYLEESAAVVSRTVSDPIEPSSNGSVTYSRTQCGPAIPNSGGLIHRGRITRQVIVAGPDGNGGTQATKHLFHFDPTTPYLSAGLELERRTYAGPGTSLPSTPVRSLVHCYAGDSSSSPKCGYQDSSGEVTVYSSESIGLNPRRQKTNTWYGPNPKGGGDCATQRTGETPACWQSAFTGWDPEAGEYGTETIGSNQTDKKAFLGSLDYRTRTTAWSPQLSTRWLPKLFSSRTTADSYAGGCQNAVCLASTTYSFDPATGYLDSTTTADPTHGTITRTFSKQTDGGEIESVTASGAGFVASTLTDKRYFQNGLVLSRRNQDASISFDSFHVTRDIGAGLVTSSADPNSVTTTYTHDRLGRLTQVESPGLHPTTVHYALPQGAHPAYVLLKRGAGDPSATTDGTVEAYAFDGLGRLTRSIARRPNRLPAGSASGSYYALQRTRYGVAGYVSFVSEWVPCPTGPAGANDLTGCFADPSNLPGTTYSGFDPFGRPRSIQKADGTTVTVSFVDADDDASATYTSYDHSDTVESVTVSVASGATTTTRRDVFGRVIRVFEPEVSGQGRRTDYAYNAFDKLAKVEQKAFDGATVLQTRTFTYDFLGLLREERVPELPDPQSPSQPAIMKVTQYDALGNARERKLLRSDGTTLHTWAQTFDPLGRLVSLTVDGDPYVTNSYDVNTFPGCSASKPLGKLTRQVGDNPPHTSTSEVVDDFCYDDAAGRLTRRRNVGLAVEAAWTYDGLGLVATEANPRRLVQDPANTHPLFTVTTTYGNGLPVSKVAHEALAGGGSTNETVVSAATYHASGALASYSLGNGVKATIEQSTASQMARPSRISTSGTATGSPTFDTGVFLCDGGGNITTMGADSFGYDTRSRLTSSTVGSGGESLSETYTYDRLGNLVSRTAGTQSYLSSASTATNRLTTAGVKYDDLGNLTSEPTSDGGYRYTYDRLSRQTGFQRGTGSNPEYWEKATYDATGERLSRTLPQYLAGGASGPTRFRTLTPCRLLDTRLGEGPPLSGGNGRTFPARGSCGIPLTARSLSANLTTVGATSSGSVEAFATTDTYRTYTSPHSTKVGRALATQLFIPLDALQGRLTLFPNLPAGQTVHAIVDVNGYFDVEAGATTAYLTFRGQGNRVLREYRVDPGPVVTWKDHVYLGNQLVGTRTEGREWRYVVTDHLGTPRLVTDASARVTARHVLRPFGEVLSPGEPVPTMGFAGMEREPLSANHYDHARYFASRPGARFLSVDALGGTVTDPQSWNRYAYARNNPLKYVDRDGKAPGDAATLGRLLTILPTVGVSAASPPLLVASAIGAVVTLGGATVGRGIGEYAAHSPSLIPLITARDLWNTAGHRTDLGSMDLSREGGERDSKRSFSKGQRAVGLDKSRDADGIPRCEYCDKPLDPKAGSGSSYEADHRDAWSNGGPTTSENLAPSCRDCNRAKRNKALDDWLAEGPSRLPLDEGNQ